MARPLILGDSILADYAARISRAPILRADEEKDLARRWIDHADKDAFDRLVESHLRYVLKLAAGYRGYGMPMADLVSEGNIGLIEAVRRFKPDLGFRLSTYALWWIKAKIQEYILHSWSMVKLGTTADQKKLFFGLAKAKRRLGIAPDATLTDADVGRLSQATGVAAGTVREMSGRLTPTSSLNVSIGNNSDFADGVEAIDLLIDPDELQDEKIGAVEEMAIRSRLLGRALETLKPRERRVFEARLLNDDPPTLEELGVEFSVSRERIRQIEQTALGKVRQQVVELAQAIR